VTAFAKLLDPVRKYYGDKVEKHGATAGGIDINAAESQPVRFGQLLKLCDGDGFSINDYGCGFGWLYRHMTGKGMSFTYRGFDISQRMIAKANELHGGAPNCEFFTDESRLTKSDYTVACGIFSVKLEAGDSEWLEYCLDTIRKIDRISGKGFAFNALTKYSDAHLMRSDLYYADPGFLFDHCKRNYSRRVALLHDYELYEFTIIVRK